MSRKIFVRDPVKEKNFRNFPGLTPKFFPARTSTSQKIFTVRPVHTKKIFSPRKDSPEDPRPNLAQYTPYPKRLQPSHDPSPTEKHGCRNPEKFGSGNDANARKNFAPESSFSENTRFNREKTGLFSGPPKCAKKGYILVNGWRLPLPDDRYCTKKEGVSSRLKNGSVFSRKTK